LWSNEKQLDDTSPEGSAFVRKRDLIRTAWMTKSDSIGAKKTGNERHFVACRQEATARTTNSNSHGYHTIYLPVFIDVERQLDQKGKDFVVV